MQTKLIGGDDVYRFTREETAQVAIIRLRCRVYGTFFCIGCGFGFVLTPNDGMGPRTWNTWAAVAHVTVRLHRGETIDGVMG